VQALTAPVAVALDAVTYLWSAALLNRIRTPEPVPEEVGPRVRVLDDIVAGVRVCAASDVIRPVWIADALMYLFAGFFMALYMLLTLRTLGLSPAVVGLIISVGGVGSFVGAWLAQPLARTLSVGFAMIVAMGVSQGANLCIALALQVPQYAVPLLVLQQLIGDMFLGAYVVHAISLRQRVLPETVLGRAGATFHATIGVMLPLGALLAGPMVDAMGLPTVVWIAACGGMLSAVVLAASPVRQLR
jgi:predicted MFS family arabinose efflux permease